MNFKTIAVLLVGFFAAPSLNAQRHAWQDELLPYRRHVRIRPLEGGFPAVVSTRFFTHGALQSEKPVVAVYARREQVPSRVLHVGPGDLLGVAFQTRKNEREYQIYYGGAETASSAPAWTSRDGLFLETRNWTDCDLEQLASVREAFSAAQKLGSDYVRQVFHRYNPFDVKPAPFLSHYTGTIHISAPGRYAFFTSSQDCSFLLIDKELVVSAPGRHRPIGRAKFKGQITLDAGPHQFDYWHAASGTQTCAVAAWQPPGADKPEVIPPTAFGSSRVAHVLAQNPEHERDGPLPDFRMMIRGEASIEDSDLWMVRVGFDGVAPSGGRGGSCTWEFGDGQTGDQWQPTHVYLCPGEYSVTLSVRQRGKVHKVTNRVRVTRLMMHKGIENKDRIEDYLPIIDTYNLAQLDLQGLYQIVLLRRQQAAWRDALEAGMQAFSNDGACGDEATCWKIAELLGSMASRRLGDSEAALKVWKATGNALQDSRRRAECALAAADVTLNELLQADAARPFLDFAQEKLRDTSGTEAARLHRIWGDWHARNGDATAAIAAYQKASEARNLNMNVTQKNARRGAFIRSTEAFLREGELMRAAEQLDQWQRDFPLDKATGYLSMLLARYWLARERPDVAIALADDLLTVSSQSPYADRLLLIQAAAEESRGHGDRAMAAYQSLLTDYPGSPHVEVAKKRLAELQADKDSQ